MEQAEILNTFFASVLASKTGLQESEAPQTRHLEHVRLTLCGGRPGLGSTSNKMDIHKSMEPDRFVPTNAEGTG